MNFKQNAQNKKFLFGFFVCIRLTAMDFSPYH